jgi:hypothetical protein
MFLSVTGARAAKPADIEKLKYFNTIKANDELFNEVIEKLKKQYNKL